MTTRALTARASSFCCGSIAGPLGVRCVQPRGRRCTRSVIQGSSDGPSGSQQQHKRGKPAQAFSKHHAAVNMLAIEPPTTVRGEDLVGGELASEFVGEDIAGSGSNGSSSASEQVANLEDSLLDLEKELEQLKLSLGADVVLAPEDELYAELAPGDELANPPAEMVIIAPSSDNATGAGRSKSPRRSSSSSSTRSSRSAAGAEEGASAVAPKPKKKKKAGRKRATAALDRTIQRDQSRRARGSTAFGVTRSGPASASATLSRRRVRGCAPLTTRRPEDQQQHSGALARSSSSSSSSSSRGATQARPSHLGAEDEEADAAVAAEEHESVADADADEEVDVDADLAAIERGDTSKRRKVKMGKARDAVENGKGLQGVDLTAYLKEISQTKLLTVKEERELSRYVQRLLQLKRLKEDVEEQLGREISRREWAEHADMSIVELADELKVCIEAKHKMISANMRLVVSVAKKYLDRGMSFQDLVQEGTQGLVRGTEKFDASKGYKFSTYAHWWIRQAVTRAIADESRVIRLPVHLFEANTRIIRCRAELEKELGRRPADDEVAKKLGMKLSKLRHIQNSCQISSGLMSIDTPLNARTHKSGEGRQRNLADLVPAPRTETPHVSCSDSLLREDLDNVLNTLSPRERDVVRLRFGLDDGRVKTLEEIGEYFEVTRERIRQIENKAIRKLKQPSRHTILRDYVDKTEAYFDEALEL